MRVSFEGDRWGVIESVWLSVERQGTGLSFSSQTSLAVAVGKGKQAPSCCWVGGGEGGEGRSILFLFSYVFRGMENTYLLRLADGKISDCPLFSSTPEVAHLFLTGSRGRAHDSTMYKDIDTCRLSVCCTETRRSVLLSTHLFFLRAEITVSLSHGSTTAIVSSSSPALPLTSLPLAGPDRRTITGLKFLEVPVTRRWVATFTRLEAPGRELRWLLVRVCLRREVGKGVRLLRP